MNSLQNNFTTPEQSKRLLELGVPADSADCFYEAIGFGGGYRQFPIICDSFNKENRIDLPCWSVGRLIEIYLTCVLEYHPYDDFYTETPSLHLMAFDKDRLIEEVIEIMSEDEMDFSKLED